MKVISLIIIAALTAVDQLLKMLVVTQLKPIGKITIIPNFLEFNYIENTGASFGILQDFGWFFIIATIVISAVIIYLFFKHEKHNFFSYYAAIAVVAGGLGNLIDRFVFSYVIDYIHVLFFPYIFNFADCLVVTGAISFIIYYIFYYEKDKKLEEVSEKSGENWVFCRVLRKAR